MALDFIHSPLFKQIMRFAVTGGIAFVIDFGLLLILTELVHLDYLSPQLPSHLSSQYGLTMY